MFGNGGFVPDQFSVFEAEKKKADKGLGNTIHFQLAQ
jgi:hypothetical protein